MNRIETAYNFIEEEEYLKAEEIGNELIADGELEGFFILTDIAHDKEEYKKRFNELLKQEEHKVWKKE